MKEIFVGQGLTPKTLEECLAQGLNPNPDQGGAFCISSDPESIRAHILVSQEHALKNLRRSS